MKKITVQGFSGKTETRYVSFDGCEYRFMRDCFEHEAMALNDEWGRIDLSGIPFLVTFPPYGDGDRDYTLYFVRNERELAAVKHGETPNIDSASHDFRPRKFPCWILVDVEHSYGYDGGQGVIEELDDVILQLHGYISELRSKTEEIERKVCRSYEEEEA